MPSTPARAHDKDDDCPLILSDRLPVLKSPPTHYNYDCNHLSTETCFSEDKGPPMTPPTHTGSLKLRSALKDTTVSERRCREHSILSVSFNKIVLVREYSPDQNSRKRCRDHSVNDSIDSENENKRRKQDQIFVDINNHQQIFLRNKRKKKRFSLIPPFKRRKRSKTKTIITDTTK